MIESSIDSASSRSARRGKVSPITANASPEPRISLSSNGDLAAVLRWLKHEWDGFQGFYGNRAMIADAHNDGRLITLRQGRGILGFAALGRCTIDILEVRPRMRRKGHGRALAIHCFDRLRDQGEIAVELECNPGASRFFWAAMGCEILERPRPAGLLGSYSLTWPLDGKNLSQDIRDTLVPVSRARKVL